MSGLFKKTIRNDLSELTLANDALHLFLGEHPLPPQATYALNLSIEELLTNIIKYSYDDTAEHVIDIQVELSPWHIVLTIQDDGQAFNPLEQEAPDITKPPEEREIGGLGLHMVREMCEEMEYRREGDRNITVVRIRV